MPRITAGVRGIGRGTVRPSGLLTPDATRRLTSRAARAGTPGLIAPGPGFSLPRIEESQWHFSPLRNDGAAFAANLLRSRIGTPQDWEATRSVAPFLQRALERFVGDRAKLIDTAFDIAVSLGPSPSTWHQQEEIDPRRITLTFRVASTVGWVNLTPALDLLKSEHKRLPTLFYHWLDDSLSRWFRVFNIVEAKCNWDSWMERRVEDEAERQEECEREGISFEPLETMKEPRLPKCIGRMPRGKATDLTRLVRSHEALALMQAAERLHRTATATECPNLSPDDREAMFPDSDQPIPLTCLAFGEHDVVTEMLNMELEVAGQVEPEPWPILQMDGTDSASIHRAFRLADVVLNTLVEASRTLALVPGFQPNGKNH